MEKEIKFYPLTTTLEGVMRTEPLCGRIYNNLCIMVNFEQDDIDPVLMEEAVNKSILRFPSTVVRLRNFTEGKTKIMKQYFVDAPESKCMTASFDSDKKMYKFIDKIHLTPFPNDFQDCDLYRIALIKRANGRYSLLVCMYHAIADAYGIISIVTDVLSVYKALRNNTEMPKPFAPLMPAYEELWGYHTSVKHDKDLAFWNKYWTDLRHDPQYITLNGFHDKSGSYIKGEKYGNMIYLLNFKATQVNYRLSKEMTEKIRDFSIKNGFSDKMLYLLALQSWFTKQSDKNLAFTINDVMANRGKRSFAKTGGCVSTAVLFGLDVPTELNVIDAAKEMLKAQLGCYKHCTLLSDESDVIAVKRMGLDQAKPMKGMWIRGNCSMLFTYQPYVPMDELDLKMSIERFTSGTAPFPLYMTVMPTDTYSGEMNINYEYMTKIYKEKDIVRFHKYLVKFLETAINHPELTLDQLIEMDAN